MHDAFTGDFKYGEDVGEGRKGLLCAEVEWTTEAIARIEMVLKDRSTEHRSP